MFKTLYKQIKSVLPREWKDNVLRHKRKYDAIVRGKIDIPVVVAVVGQACTYKCKDCGNFAPYAPKEFMHYDCNQLMKDFETFFNAVRRVDNFQLQGGEPFAYRELPELLECLVTYRKKIGQLVVATNGTIIPKEEVLIALKKVNAVVRISDYGLERTKKNIKMLIDTCNHWGIENVVYEFGSGIGKWYNCGDIATKHMEKDIVSQKKYDTCGFNICLTLERGEFSHCSRATNAYILQGFARKEDDYVKLYDEQFKEKIANYVYNSKFMEACKYCNGTSENNMIPAAIQLEE